MSEPVHLRGFLTINGLLEGFQPEQPLDFQQSRYSFRHSYHNVRPVMTTASGVTNGALLFYHETLGHGRSATSDALAVDQVSALLDEAHRLIAGISKSGEGYPQYDASGGELAAPSPVGRVLARYETANGTAFESTDAPIARLGCSIHQNLPAFLTITHSAFHRSIAKALDCAVPLVTQSQLITKPARVGSRINPHQDGCSSFTYPPSAVTFWYALEDASINNGCLLVAPGSHLTEPLRQRLAKSPQDGRPEFIQLRKPAWATNAVDSGFELHHAREYEYVPLEVTRGTLILCHGNLMHASGANRSERGRVAYVFTIIDGRFHCPDDAYLRPTTGGFLKL